MTTKYRGYLGWMRDQGPERRFGVKSLRVLTVAPTPTRVARLRDAGLDATDGRGSGFLWFVSESVLDCAEPEKILMPTCSVARANDVRPQRLLG